MATGGAGWFWFSVVATLCVAPVFVAIPFFGKNFQVTPEVFTAWYFAGVSLGVALWLAWRGRVAELVPARPVALAGVVLVGLILGAAANSSLFRAVSLAPNPGMPPVIYSGASVIVFLGSAVLADRLPRFFTQVSTDLDRFLGILLVITGVFLTAGGWSLLRHAVGR